MEWKDVASTVARSAPMLGGLLGGPVGAAVGAVGSMIASALGVSSTPDAVSQALQVNPEAAVKLAQIEKDRQVELQQLVVQAANNQLQAETAQLVSVNTTMQAETKSEHWASWLWRPFMGFIAGIMIFGCYFVLPLAHIAAPVIPGEVWYFLGAVLGVASWFRGKAQADPANPAQVHG
jgi:Fe2+ transport system protein B